MNKLFTFTVLLFFISGCGNTVNKTIPEQNYPTSYSMPEYYNAEITQEKYNKISEGMRLDEVEKIMGMKGQELNSRIGDIERKQVFWINAKERKNIGVLIENGKVTQKYASGF